MKKDLGQNPPILKQALALWVCWPLALQLLVFWLVVVFGALIWAGSLWLAAGRPALNRVSSFWQTVYLIGLYTWLLWLCHQARCCLSLPTLPIWRPRKQIAVGAALAGFSLLLLTSLAWVLGWGQLQVPRTDWPLIGLQVLLMAIAIATIEEIVFRGLMLDLALRSQAAWQALGIQALIYALLHLFRSDLDPLTWLNALISLVLTGLLLGQLRLRHASLAMSVGLHGGWVACTSFASWTALFDWQPAWARWSGLGNPAYGLSGLILLLLLNGWVVYRGLGASKTLLNGVQGQ